MGNLRFQLLSCCIILTASQSHCSGTEFIPPEKLAVDKTSDILSSPEGVPPKREPISENSTLGQALALARQFLTRDENIVTSVNVELFKRSDGAEALLPGKATDKPKLFSWWSKKPTEYLPMITTEEPEEESEEEMTDPPEEPSSTMAEIIQTSTEETTVQHTSATSAPIPSTPDLTTPPKSPSPTSDSEPMPSTPESDLTITPSPPPPNSKRTRKPRPSKRPKTKRPTLTTLPSESDLVTNPESDTTMSPGDPALPPNSIKDPFGVKRKLAALARSVGKAVLNQSRTLAAKTAERIVPAAQDGARQLGIIALTAAGQVGKLTKNTASNAFEDLARKLNATELVAPKRVEPSPANPFPDPGPGNGHTNVDLGEENCSAADKPGHFGTVFLGTVGLLWMRQIVS